MRPSGSQQGATPRKSNLESMMESFVVTQTRHSEEFINQNLNINEVLRHITTKIKFISTPNKMLETHIS